MHLYHRDLGGAGNPPLVILHGLLGSSRNWQTAGVEMAARYHVFALDLRNHGRSPHADAMDFDVMVADVLEWMAEHLLTSATIMGHSMGGKVAMQLACRHPAQVERLFIIDIAPKDYAWMGHRASFAAMNELALADLHSRAEAELRFEGRVPNWATRKFLTTNLERTPDGHWRWQINLPAITASLPTIEANSLTSTDRYVGPARFITGADSTYVEPADHAAIRGHFPNADIVTIPGSGHNPHMEQREAFVRVVLAK